MVSEERVTVHNTEDAKIVQEIFGQKRTLCIATGEVLSLQISLFLNWLLFLFITLKKF